jgi:hypothetical protein
MTAQDKKERAEHANTLINLIAAHGRRFFYNKEHNRVAKMYLDARGRVWFVDDYRETHIYTHWNGSWRGFSHGGTLRDLTIQLRDYIRTGELIHHGVIAPSRFDPDRNIWGYSFESAEKLRELTRNLPMFKELIK